MEQNETVKRTRKWLSDDFQTHKRKASLSSVLPSAVSYDGMPSSPSFGNAQENKLVEYADSKVITEAVDAVINVMSDCETSRHATVLKLCFKDEVDDMAVMERLNMGDRSFYYNKHHALLEFAVLFEPWVNFNQ